MMRRNLFLIVTLPFALHLGHPRKPVQLPIFEPTNSASANRNLSWIFTAIASSLIVVMVLPGHNSSPMKHWSGMTARKSGCCMLT